MYGFRERRQKPFVTLSGFCLLRGWVGGWGGLGESVKKGFFKIFRSFKFERFRKTEKIEKLKEMSYRPQKKLLKRTGNSITPAKANVPISQASSEDLKLTIQTYQMSLKWSLSRRLSRNLSRSLSNELIKELKIKLRQIQEEISKASLPVSADLSNDFKSIILETDQRKIYPSWG